MESHPERGKVTVQVFGNSSHSYKINGTKLIYGKIDLPEGLYTVTSNSIENTQSAQLNLSSASSGYVIGLFESSRNKPVHFQICFYMSSITILAESLISVIITLPLL